MTKQIIKKLTPNTSEQQSQAGQFLISLAIVCLSIIFDLQFVGESGHLNQFNLPAFTLTFGISLITLSHFGPPAYLSILLAPTVAMFFLKQLHALDLAYSPAYTLIAGSLLVMQSAVLSKSFASSSKYKKLSTSKKLIVFVSQATIVTAFISILLIISKNYITQTQLDLLQVLSIWSCNLTSLIIVCSLFYSLVNHRANNKQTAHPIEWFICLSVTILGVYFARFIHVGFALVIIPALMWSSVRFSQLLSASAVLISTFLFLNILGIETISLQYLLPDFAPIFTLLLFSITALYFSSLRVDQIYIEEKLEDIVQQRTQDLLNAIQELRDEVFIREQAEHNLLNTSMRYRALIETAGIPIIVLDTKFRVKQWNTAAELQFSYTKEEVLGCDFIDKFIPEPVRDETAWKFMKVLESGLSKENMEGEVISRDGLSHTMLWNMTYFSGDETGEKQNQLLLMGQNISGIRKTQDQLHYLAHYDALTDTANRRLFEDRCAQAIQSAIRHKSEIALIGLDIDHFKRINDTLGHDVGDQLLTTLSQRLKESVRKEDTVARLGGDEFAILLASVSGREGAEVVARNILRSITQPILIKGNELIVTSSIGITICPNDGTHYPDLLKNADMAMYRAKKAGRNNIQFYSPEMNSEMKRQLRVEQELRFALSDNQFKLYYQPVIDIETGEVLALETLLRWQHPERGLISPDYFIDIAEQTGQLHEIGKWVIMNACLQGRVIQEWSLNPVQIALNLSSRQFNHPTLVDTIDSITRETRFSPRNLILEMSESTITHNLETTNTTLNDLKALGVSLTIDSFGTGLSSLRQLKQIPVDIIKIDRTFVTGIPTDESDMAITETLLAIASQMDLKTFATGIETKEQEAFLKINGCRYGQGYLYSHPIPFKQLPELFSQITSGKALGEGNQIFLPFQANDQSDAKVV